MKRIEYRFRDSPAYIYRDRWDPGPWDDEPDKIQWQDEATGLPCLIVRNRMGNLCGYVGVAEDHPYFGMKYDEPDVSVYGGLTFADSCHEHPENFGICHIPDKGEPDHVWWLGFDCGHCGDIHPADTAIWRLDDRIPMSFPEATYKDIAFVEGQVRDLARQLKGIGDGV